MDIPDTIQDLDIKPPHQLKPPASTGRPTVYTKELAQSILIDIATSGETIENIAKKHGINKLTFYRWVLINEAFCNAHLRALENRAIVLSGNITEDLADLAKIVENEDKDPRDRHVRLQYFDKKWNHLQWLMSKYNRKLFGDKLEVDQNVTINPTEAREQAWQQHRAVEAEYTEES